MLSDWYFCCCIGISAEKAYTFLSILNTIQNQDEAVDDELLFIAYTELCQTEIWMQIYALPYVLRSLYYDLASGPRRMVGQYLNELVELFPDQMVREQFEDLKDSILSQGSTEDMLQIMKSCARAIETPPMRVKTETPYLDLETFLPETFFLAVLSNQFFQSKAFSSALLRDMQRSTEISPIEILLEKALNHQFGRQAFLLAAHLAPLTLQKYEGIEIAHRIWSTPNAAAEIEPDLIQTAAKVLYENRRYEDQEENFKSDLLAVEIVHETISFSRWHSLCNKSSHYPGEEAILRRLGLGGSNQIEALPRILWQAVLWEMAAHIDPRTTANNLKYHWSAPRNLPVQLEPVNISAPYSRDEGIEWIADLSTLYPLQRDKPIELRFYRNSGSPFIQKTRLSQSSISWLFFSPWLQINNNNIDCRPQKGESRPPRYLKAQNTLVLLRLLASARVAMILLRHLSSNDQLCSPYAALVAHAYDVLYSSYHNQLMFKKPDATRQSEGNGQVNDGGDAGLTIQMVGLSVFCYVQLDRVGQVKIEHLSPETFLNLLRYPNKYHYLDKTFLDFVLPEVLMLWIEDAYIDATDKKGAGRWLRYINEVYDYHKQDRRHDRKPQYRAALLVRFLGGPRNLSMFDWLNNPRKGWKFVEHRQLLLSPDLPPTEWKPEGAIWKDPDWEMPNPKSKKNLKLIHLARSIQRLAAFTSHDLKTGEQVQLKDQWFEEWQNCMYGIDKISLDRFMRLSLLELIDKPALADSSEGQELIAHTLLEFGAPYDLQELVNTLFWRDRHSKETLDAPLRREGSPFAPGNTARQRVRKSVLRAMYQYTEQMNATIDESHQNARVPYKVRAERKKYLFFFQTLLRMACLVREYSEDRVASELRTTLVHFHNEALKRKQHEVLKTIQGDVEQLGRQKRILLPKGVMLQDSMLRGASYDPNMLKLTLYYEDLDFGTALNLFEASKEEINRFCNERKKYPGPSNAVQLVGVVVDEIAQSRSGMEYEINCGLDRYVTARLEAEKHLSFGMYVRVSVFWDERYRKWHTQNDLQPLKRSLSVGGINKASVREYWREPIKKRRLSLRYQGKECFTSDRENSLDYSIRRLWDADLSRIFLALDQPPERFVYVENKGNNVIVPLEHSFFQLLLDGYAFANGKVFILVLIEAHIDEFSGERSWLFSTRPGENYRLYKNEFQPDTVAELEQHILEIGSDDAAGLLIAMSPVINQEYNTVCLEFCKEKVEDEQLITCYPEFTWPIDRRNCEWRTFFDNEGLIAEREGNSWFVRNDLLPGYPSKIRIEWKERNPSYNDTKADLASVEWNEEKWFNQEKDLYVEADCEVMRKLRPEQNWQSLLDRLLNLREGNRMKLVQVKSPLATRGDGTVLCLTSEGLMIRVDVESLTMIPLEMRERPLMEKPREAEIYHFSKRYTRVFPIIEDTSRISSGITIDTCLGIIVGMPVASDQTSTCTVLWKTAEGCKNESIIISNLVQLSQEGVGLGSKIEGRWNGREWDFRIETRAVLARALWKVQEWDNLALNDKTVCTYLGTMYYNKQDRPIAEVYPGLLALFQHIPAGAQHLAQIHDDGSGSFAVLRQGVHTGSKVQNKTKPVPIRNVQTFYHIMLSQGEKVFTGQCRDQTYNPLLLLTAISMKGATRFDGLLLLQREFKLRLTTSDILVQKKEASTQEKLLQKLDEYFKDRLTLESQIHSGNRSVRLQNLQVPQDLPPYERWSFIVPLADNETPFVADANYAPQTTVRLLKEPNGRVVASIRDVTPLTPEEYQIYLNTPGFNELVTLKDYSLLYYVGPETVHPMTGEPYPEGLQYRFEWGRGQTLLISESQLLFNGEPFRSSSLLLCHGDSIATLQFLEGENGSCIISIAGYSLQFSPARTLYVQRKEFKIVHILHLLIAGGYVYIEFIEGFNEHGDTTTLPFRLRGPRAMQLTEESEQRLLARESSNVVQGEQLRIGVLGRLDLSSFEETLGRELHFEHVRFSFKNTEAGPGLQGNELVFVQAGQIVPRQNDMALQIGAHSILKKVEIGDDMTHNLQVLRRKFSVRENLLSRLYETGNKDYLEGVVLLVRFSFFNDGKIRASMVEGIPSRKTKALTFSDQNTTQLVTIVRTVTNRDGEHIRVELKPGIFIDIPCSLLKAYSGEVIEGTIVSIERTEETVTGPGNREQKSFIMTRASFSDEHYIPESTRFVVTLPKNDLLTEQVWERDNIQHYRFWQDRRSFTIGGLPNIVASPATYNQREQQWSSPRPDEIIRLMETVHPKVVRLGKDNSSKYIAPAPADVPVGHLERIQGGLGVRYIPLSGESATNRVHSLVWRYLSFGDETVIDIMERIDRENWSYHDSKTGHWSGEKIEYVYLSKQPYTSWTGPLFFEPVESTKRLRYSAENFLKYAFPVEELIYLLKDALPLARTYPVAGVSTDESIWLETSPGRLIEVPTQRIVWQFRGNKKSLTHLQWESFALGDKLTLSVSSGDPLAIDRIVLQKWLPGVRAAFGESRCILPVQDYDSEKGALKLGAGNFTLTLPAEYDQRWRSVVLYPNNNLHNLTKEFVLTPGDVVLLGLDDKNTPVVLGMMARLTALQDLESASWEGDQLGLVGPNMRYLRRLVDIIRAAGGALPVMVNKVVEHKQLVYFSTPYLQQAAKIPVGKMTIASIIGGLSNGTEALLRIGGGLTTISMSKLIVGLPEDCTHIALAMLQQTSFPIWLRRINQETIQVGMEEERRADIIVDAIQVVIGSNVHNNGIICQSTDTMKLYWLPATSTSWAQLSAEQLSQVFTNKKNFKVLISNQYRSKPYVSITEVQDIRKELGTLAIGKELHVRILEETHSQDDIHSYLAEHFGTGTILRCESYNNEQLQPGDEIPVEVIQVVSGKTPLVVVAPLGKRKYLLDLPKWMIRNEEDVVATTEPASLTSNWLSEQPYEPTIFADNEDLHKNKDGELDRLLYAAFLNKDKLYIPLQSQVEVAVQWYKQHIHGVEISVGLALMTIILLDEAGRAPDDVFRNTSLQINDLRYFRHDWRSYAAKLAYNIGRRALRSAHIEVLSSKWLYNPTNRVRIDTLWKRLQTLKGEVLHENIQSEKIADIRKFCQTILLRDSSIDLISIAQALAAATGQPVDMELIKEKSEHVQTLIELYETLPRPNMELYLHESHINRLKDIVGSIRMYKADIILLDPLPKLFLD